MEVEENSLERFLFWAGWVLLLLKLRVVWDWDLGSVRISGICVASVLLLYARLCGQSIIFTRALFANTALP